MLNKSKIISYLIILTEGKKYKHIYKFTDNVSIDSENVFTDLTKNFDKQMQDWNSAILDYTSPIKTMIEDVRKYLLEKPVVTEIEGGIKYTTTIKDNGALYNILANEKPDANDEYWLLHNKQSHDIQERRQETINNLIKKVGNVLEKIVVMNPASSMATTISDIVKVISVSKDSRTDT